MTGKTAVVICVNINLCFSVIIEDLPGQGSYIVNINSSICWDSNKTCDYNVKIFESIQLPKPKCNLNKGYQTKGELGDVFETFN